jgi:hypothetical protein
MDNLTDRLYIEDSIKYLAHELDKEILMSLASMPVLEIKPNEPDFSDFKLVGVDLALRPDVAYVNGVFVISEEE